MMSQISLTPLVGPEDHVQGPPRAPLTLVEYAGYECPQSGRAHAVLRIVLPQLDEEVRFVFRNFPLTDPHPRSQPAAEAAESVAAHGGDDAFWAMHDILYENQDALEDDDLIVYAEAVGADPHTVADDIAMRTFADRIGRDVRSGLRSGVDTTPTFFLNGRRFHGLWSDAAAFIDDLRAAVRSGADGGG
jgi:protein-disulfide isomerase